MKVRCNLMRGLHGPSEMHNEGWQIAHGICCRKSQSHNGPRTTNPSFSSLIVGCKSRCHCFHLSQHMTDMHAQTSCLLLLCTLPLYVLPRRIPSFGLSFDEVFFYSCRPVPNLAFRSLCTHSNVRAKMCVHAGRTCGQNEWSAILNSKLQRFDIAWP